MVSRSAARRVNRAAVVHSWAGLCWDRRHFAPLGCLCSANGPAELCSTPATPGDGARRVGKSGCGSFFPWFWFQGAALGQEGRGDAAPGAAGTDRGLSRIDSATVSRSRLLPSTGTAGRGCDTERGPPAAPTCPRGIAIRRGGRAGALRLQREKQKQEEQSASSSRRCSLRDRDGAGSAPGAEVTLALGRDRPRSGPLRWIPPPAAPEHLDPRSVGQSHQLGRPTAPRVPAPL